MTSTDITSVAFVVQEGRYDDLLAEIESEGGQRKGNPETYNPPAELADMFGDQQFEPLMVVAVSLSVGFLLKRIAKIYSDLKHPKGILVDTRESPAKVIETKSLDRGDVVILYEDRTESFSHEEKDAALSALEGIFGGS